jgi:multimeric flavodoxin WrbA
MQKKILGVVGSPRKNGNTDILVSKVLAGASSVGALTKLIRLGDFSIKECDGCHACWKGEHCAKKDDMEGFYREIIQSDCIVLGTPVYWYGPTALMKGFIDRLVFFNSPRHRELVRGKSLMIVIPFEETDMNTVKPVIEFFDRCFTFLEMKIVEKLVVPGVNRKGEVAESPKWPGEAFESGQKLGSE